MQRFLRFRTWLKAGVCLTGFLAMVWLFICGSVVTWLSSHRADVSVATPPIVDAIADAGTTIRIRILRPPHSIATQAAAGDLRFLANIYRSGHVWLQADSWRGPDNPSGSYGFYFPGRIVGEDLAADEATHEIILPVKATTCEALHRQILASQRDPPWYTLVPIGDGYGNCISWICHMLDASGIVHPLVPVMEPHDLLRLRQTQPFRRADQRHGPHAQPLKPSCDTPPSDHARMSPDPDDPT